MMLTPVLEGWFSALLWFTSTLLPLGTGWLLVSHRWPMFNPEAFIEQRGLPLGLILTAGLISRRFAPSELTTAIAFTTLFMILADIAIQRWLAPYYSASRLIVLAIGGGGLGGLVWSGCYVQPFLLTGYSWGLWFVSYLLFWSMAGWGLITFLPNIACLLRRHWQRPRLAPPLHPRQHYPKVSLHLPCYAEPPEVICATLATLADLDYPHYEVLVVDNNTPDRHLWEPIERYCHELNILAGHVRFRFFHVDNLAGAKAGALNYALARTATDADLIGVVDADYQVNGDFLARLVGFFDDPAIGFVQTPHDYRDWQQSWYLRGCYWEYMSFFRLQLAGLNEWSASYIIGTMCLIRKAALMELGGWAQWCLTEDSELAVRIHSGGYQSLFLTESFGKGLIPETFAGYKKQRLRWTMGPIQQLRRHWRQYLPRRWSVPTQLTGIQKFLELSHSLSGLFPLFIFVQLPLTGAWLFHLQQHQVTIPLPNLVWYSAVNTLIAGLGLSWLTYYLLGCRQWRDMGMAMMAMMALQHTKTLGALKAVLTPQSLQWQRTNKFCVFPQRWRAFQSTQTECLLSLLFAGAAIALGSMATSRPDFVWLVIAQCVGFSLSYGSAIIMAHLAEVDIAEQKKYLGIQDCKPLLPSHSVKGTL